MPCRAGNMYPDGIPLLFAPLSEDNRRGWKTQQVEQLESLDVRRKSYSILKYCK